MVYKTAIKDMTTLVGYNILTKIVIFLRENEDSANHQESHTETCHTDAGFGYNDCHHGK